MNETGKGWRNPAVAGKVSKLFQKTEQVNNDLVHENDS